jgi:hypothetical protein
MDANFIEIPGERVAAESLAGSKARELVAFLASDVYPYAKMDSPFRSGDGCEGVIADLYLEVGQEPVNDVHPIERVALLFSCADESYPEILSLRADFPQVPHLNLREHEYPRSLCIYGEPYPVVRLTWTPARFLERIRMWFRDTARGALHRDDQPLEPILMPGPKHLVVPADLFSRGNNDAPEKLWIVPRYLSPPSELPSELLIARRTDKITRQERQQALAYLATTFQCPAQTHGVIRQLPKSLLDVHDLMVAAGVDLLSVLRERMLMWNRDEAPLGARLILIAFFPKTRTTGKPPEVSDIWAFLTVETIRQLGGTLGFWQVLPNGQVAALIGADIDRQKASAIEVFVLNPSFALNRFHAALVNGYAPSTIRITAIGVGALGSQVIAKLVRGGFGSWTLVDNDHMLPHNVARHELPECSVGFPKALAMQMLGNDLIEEQAVSDAIVADILRPRDKREHIEAALKNADLILDFSASIPVARHLAASNQGPRRISAFLNSDASDLVLLAEDAERQFPLDCLELQYYREIITRPELSDHLAEKNDKRIRYGQTCRDLTSNIPEDLVGLHSAIASKAIRRVAEDTNATICVWRTAPDLSIKALTVQPAVIREVAQGNWRIRTDDVLLRRVSALRTERLPNETGGIFIGAFDFERKIVYVVDTVPSPPDSTEWPVLYIRGCQGLPERLQQIDQMTVGMLQYVGEWHSHPDCCSTSPSADDSKVFQWLYEHMRVDGLPPMMAIVGEGGKVGWFLGSLA